MAEARPDFTALAALYETVCNRRTADPESSYTARLMARGPSKIAQKLGEEAVEASIEAVRIGEGADRHAELASESADLLYHLLVMWADAGIDPADVMAQLEAHMGTSGHDVQKARKPA